MSKKYLFLWVAWVLATTASPVPAETVRLTPDHPERYVVAKGDTLWDISARFLRDPWLWPEIWQINPEINNPHLIYPGDVIRLEFVEGRPVLKVDSSRARATVRLAPQPRISRLESAIPTIPIDAIEQFLKYPRIVTEQELEASPYIVASSDGRLISGTGNKVYARGIDGPALHRYTIVRRGQVYREPDAGNEILGYEAIHVGDGKITRFGDPSTLLITYANREVLTGDRLLPALEETLEQNFIPHAPDKELEGKIISVLDGVSHIGQFQIVVVDKGLRDGLEPGHVLAVYQTGEQVRDTIAPKKMGRRVRLPNERAGTLMLIRLFDRVSYALVMEATRDLRVYDTVTNP